MNARQNQFTSVLRAVAASVLTWFGSVGPAEAAQSEHTDHHDVQSEDPVLIAVESEAPHFKQAAAASARVLREAGRSAEIVTVASLDDARSVAERSGHVIAIGSRVAMAMAQTLPSERVLFYCLVAQPHRLGLTSRAASSGVSIEISLSTQLEATSRLLPDAKTIGILYRSSDPSSASLAASIQQAGQFSHTFVAVDADTFRSKADAIEHLTRTDIDLIWTGADTSIFDGAAVKTLLLQSLKQGVPVYGFSAGMVKAGAAFGLTTNPVRHGEQVASALLAGTLDSHSACPPDLAINATVLDRLDISITPKARKEADIVFGE